MSELDLAKRFAKDCAWNVAQTHALIAIAEELKRANEARAVESVGEAVAKLLGA
ncbi:hypothetical protein JF714_15745 [Mycobacterium avium]|uniref:hypothetical protein n=1 Tax=Mycobacterium avium TaxID=1764 RepID=UPI001CDA89F8|nr:hypothetical protein [Mycobacterium avium]MCA2331896.1 hypothetical protein [Mycobacterium avium]